MTLPGRLLRFALALLPAALVSACATAEGWRGVDSERAYEVAAAQSPARAQAPATYFEIHRDGRILVFSQADAYQSWRRTGEISQALTQVGAGPHGETLIFQLTAAEAGQGEGSGAAQRLFGGELMGIEAGFHGEIHRRDAVWIFTRGSLLREFQLRGDATCVTSAATGGTSSRPVRLVQGCAAASVSTPRAVLARHRRWADLPE